MMSGAAAPMGGLVVTHHVRVDPTRSMKSVTGDVQALLEEHGDEPRRSCALLASELIAQIVGREQSWEGDSVGPRNRSRNGGSFSSTGWQIAGASAEGPAATSGPRSTSRWLIPNPHAPG